MRHDEASHGAANAATNAASDCDQPKHSAFICRNELTQEWKRDEFYIIRDEETGEVIPVNELDTEVYNQYFDLNAFEYDASKNKYDSGEWVQNCLTFWFTSRDENG